MKQKNYLAVLKILTLTTIFTLLIIIIFLLSTKISEINNKKNKLLQYSTEAYIKINDLHNNIINNKNQINFDTIKKLKKLLANSIVNIKKYNNQSIFLYNNNLTNIINNIDFLWKDILFDINSLLDNEEKIYNLFIVLEQLHVLLVQTKADCKNLIEEMLVINANTNKISLAQQTIWLSERATNNIDSYIKDINTVSSNDNFTKDIKNLLNIISSLKNGNSLINTTKIEDKSVIHYVSKIDIKKQKTVVLFTTIDDKLITFSHVNAIAESIEQSIIKFNEYLINLNNVLINNEAYNNIFMFVYASLLLLIILTLVTTIFIVKQYYYKKNTDEIFNFNDKHSYLNKLVSDIESLSSGNPHIKLTSNNKLTPLTTAINKYIDSIVQHINKIYNEINSIAKVNINIDKYKNFKVDCLENIITNVNKHAKEVEYFINKNKKIVDTAKYYTTNTEELMLLIDKLPTMVDIINSKIDNLKQSNNTIKGLTNIIKDSNDLTIEIDDSLEIFILNYEIKGYNIDNKAIDITDIKDKIKTLKQQHSLMSSTLVNINTDQNFNNVTPELILLLNELLEANKKSLHSHKLIKSQLSTTTDKHDTNSKEVILKNIALLDKAFSKLLNDKQIIKTTINNIETIMK
jgi:hypothetical protein